MSESPIPPRPEYQEPTPTSATTPASYGSAPPAGAIAPTAGGSAMKRRNPFAVWIGLPLITLGIYHFVWYYKINNELSHFNRKRPVSPSGPVLVLIFLGWTIIAPVISFHNTGKRIAAAQEAAGLPPTCSPALSWVLWFVFGTNTLYMQIELDKIVDAYPGAAPGVEVPVYA
jgi:hypothetical protein